MKNKTMEKLQIGLMVLATMVLIVMNVFAFDTITLGVLRVLLAGCWIGIGILLSKTRNVKTQKTEEG